MAGFQKIHFPLDLSTLNLYMIYIIGVGEKGLYFEISKFSGAFSLGGAIPQLIFITTEVWSSDE